jgi:hypothetical protein
MDRYVCIDVKNRAGIAVIFIMFSRILFACELRVLLVTKNNGYYCCYFSSIINIFDAILYIGSKLIKFL